MDFKVDLFEVFSGALKICKEQEYLVLQEKVNRSYIELMEVEANTRREKASTIIKGMQMIDRELKMIKFEYGRVKSKYHIDKVTAIDEYITAIEKYRLSMALEKSKV